WGKAYAGNEDIRHPLASPLYADLTGLPPLYIQVSTDEMLLDDSVRLHERALLHGVNSTLEKWKGLIHVWHVHTFLPEAKRAIGNIAEFANRHIS
ncbi:MAG TPA: alpha/beta hydrolase fold domain-containing protein, partial [Chitinophagales bacterium]|nr:alpha/beta hydrolase fold domain-containing protein [Chitinophagales bacterium]